MSTATQNELLRFERFSEKQGGTMPPAMARIALRLTSSGLFNAGERGSLSYVRVAGMRHYGMKSVKEYRWSISRKFDTGGYKSHDHSKGGEWFMEEER